MRQKLTHLLRQNPSLFSLQNHLTNSTWPTTLSRLNPTHHPLRLLSLFNSMQTLQSNGPLTDPYIYASLLKALTKLGATPQAKSLHCHVIRINLEFNLNLCNSILSFYSNDYKLVVYACRVFAMMPTRNVVSVNCMIAGFVRSSDLDTGVGLFTRVLCRGFGVECRPSYVTLVVLVAGCVELGAFRVGRMMHSYGCKTGLDSVNEVCNVLIDLYAKNGRLGEAERVFGEMPDRDLVSWNSMVSGCAAVGDCGKALWLFREMRAGGVGFDRVSLIGLVSAAANGRDRGVGEVVHGFMIVTGAEITEAIGTALIDMYSRCGSTKCARKILDEAQDESIALWNAMIHGYVESGHNQEALELFDQIQSRKLRPDEVTMVGLILAIRNSGDLSHGIGIHNYIENDIHLRRSIVLHNALIDMYAKCGNMSRAKAVFDNMPSRDVVSWTSIIMGHAIHGEGKEAILAFRKMCANKVDPNSVTFIGVLSACDHAGLVDEGLNLYDDMCKVYLIKPQIEHYGCIIDMLARAGRLEEAHVFVKTMPTELNAVVWRMLVNACRVHGDFNRGLCLVSGSADLNNSHGSEDHVTSSNILADAGKWDDVLKERSLTAMRTLTKVSGKSFVTNFRV